MDCVLVQNATDILIVSDNAPSIRTDVTIVSPFSVAKYNSDAGRSIGHFLAYAASPTKITKHAVAYAASKRKLIAFALDLWHILSLVSSCL